jgi:formamidopyrimidine-DNA glycosylase
MKHRWDKGKKGANVLPNGEKIIHLKVGGRTSAVVPSVQKKTGPVAGDVKEEDLDSDEDVKPKAKKIGKARKSDVKPEASPATANSKRARKPAVKEIDSDADSSAEEETYTPKATSRKRKSAGSNGVHEVAADKTPKKAKTVKTEALADSGKRRSGRGVN